MRGSDPVVEGILTSGGDTSVGEVGGPRRVSLPFQVLAEKERKQIDIC